MHVPRMRALVISAALIYPLLASAGPAALRGLVDQAWQRSPAGRAAPARLEEVAAIRALSASWLAGQPVLGLGQRDGRWTSQPGVRESEVSLSAPLWMPAQRSARRQLAELSAGQLQAELRKLRLDIAGEVRTRLWDAAATQAQLQEQEGQQRNTQALAAEVRRRVHAGDLARADGLLADQEVLATEVALEQARAQADAALGRLRLLTGPVAALPLEPEPLPPQQLAAAGHDDPRLLAAQATTRRAQAALELARASRREPPAVSLSLRQERAAPLDAPERTLAVALQIPLGSAGRNRPAEAAARAVLAEASAEAEQAQARAASELDIARSALQHARAALTAAGARVAAIDQHQQLTDKAFRLGERGLADVLRSRTLLHEARVAQRQQEVAVGRAHAQLNQASGVLP